MITEGMPWPIVLPITVMALVYGVMASKKEIKAARKASTIKTKKS